MSLRRVFANAGWLGGLQTLNLGLSLITLPVVTRAFGPSIYGHLAAASAWTGYAALLVTFGFHLTGPKRVSRAAGDVGALSQIISSILVAQVLIAAGCLAVFTVVLLSFGAQLGDLTVLAMLFGTAIAMAANPVWMLAGLESFREIAVPQFLIRATSTLAIIALIRDAGDVRTYVAIGLASATINVAATFLLLSRKGIRARVVPFAAVAANIREAFMIFLSSASINIYTTANVIVVNSLLGATAAGHFALADRIRATLIGGFDAVSQALYPYLCRTIGDGTTDFARARKVSFVAIMGASVVVGVALAIAAPLIVALLGGEAFAECVTILRIFAFAPFLICLSNILGIQTMLPNDMEKEFGLILALGAAVGLPLLAVFSLSFGVAGSAASYILTEALITLAMAIAVNRQFPMSTLFAWPSAWSARKS